MKHKTRKSLLLPALAVALLSGCVGYGYRGGHGDYYYGAPASEYGYPYGYDTGYGYGYPVYYGSPYWSGSFGYYGYYGPRRPPRHDGGHGNGHGNGHGDDHGHGGSEPPPPASRPDHSLPPWRALGKLERQDRAGEPGQRPIPRSAPVPQVERAPQRPAPAQRVQRVERAAPPAPIRTGANNPKRDFRRNPAP